MFMDLCRFSYLLPHAVHKVTKSRIKKTAEEEEEGLFAITTATTQTSIIISNITTHNCDKWQPNWQNGIPRSRAYSWIPNCRLKEISETSN